MHIRENLLLYAWFLFDKRENKIYTKFSKLNCAKLNTYKLNVDKFKIKKYNLKRRYKNDL